MSTIDIRVIGRSTDPSTTGAATQTPQRSRRSTVTINRGTGLGLGLELNLA